MDDESTKTFGELPTWGREEPPEPEIPSEGALWSERGLSEAETLRPGAGIGDDGRTDAGRRWKAGETILERYVVERELGQGGMGVVYGCRDKVGGVRVAVKSLPPELSHNSVEMEEVRENFRLVYGLSHPNIAGVRQLERDGRGEYYLVMEEAEGENLRHWLRGKWKSGGVSLAEAVAVLRQVAAALDYAHGKKVVHRDVKPGNVVIDRRTGEAKVLDFGLASQIRTSMSRASHASRGTSGTGPYMAPEQWQGKQQDGAADQYALGVMAYEMLAGHLPFEGSELAVLKDAVLHGTADPVPGLPKGAMAALRRAMAKRKEERFASCGEFVEALAGKGQAGHGGRSARGKTLAGWLAALAVLAGLGAGVWRWGGHDVGGGALGKSREMGGDGNAVEETALPEGWSRQAAGEERRPGEGQLATEGAAEAAQLPQQQAAGEGTGRREEEDAGAEGEETVPRMAEEAAPEAGAIAGNDRGQGGGDGTEGREEDGRLRTEAIQAGRLAGNAMKKAEELDGVRALQSYKHACYLATKGKVAFEGARFKEAAEAWNGAAMAYGSAETEARAAKAQAAQAAERSGTWKQVLADAEKVLALDPENAEAQRLKKAAEAASRPVSVAHAGPKAGNAAGAARTEASPHRTGETKTIMLPGGAAMEMVWCPAGDFAMGSPPGEPGRFVGKTPHRVVPAEGFWIAKYEVTQKQWTGVMGTTLRQQRDKGDASLSLRGEGDDYPMYFVNLEEAEEFCRKAGHGLQLPTEAQWEYACRAGKTGEYGGTGRLEDMGWYSENSVCQTHPVGEKDPNAWGLHDMHGNVWEWCADGDGAHPGGAGTKAAEPDPGSYHAMRGGSWNSVEAHCRSAFRDEGAPGSRDYNLGFRPVSVLP